MATTFFHSQVLFNIVQKANTFHPVYLNYSNNNHFLGLRVGIIFSKRIVIYGFPTNSIEELSELLPLIQKYSKGIIYTEFRNLYDQTILKEVLAQYKFYWLDWLNIFVNTTDKEVMWKSINDGKQLQIRKSLNNGAELCLANCVEEVHQFYNILSNLYKNKIHKPLPDWSFFKAFYEETKDTEWGRFILVKCQGKVIAGMMCPITPNQEMYEWYMAGLDHKYKGLGIYPSVLVTWGAMKYACKHNIPKFNFMGAGQPDKPYGVRDFKMQFGGVLVNSGRFIKINKPLLYKLGRTYLKIKGRL
ncbi:peptidoglycan bridge formation glycyltransferase FemA/FemB family protein [Bacteroidota bacterium]